MKIVSALLACASMMWGYFPIIFCSEIEKCDISLEAFWQNLDTDDTNIIEFGGKWILAGSITFHKKAKETIYLNKINLHWQGQPLAGLNGSLYRKETEPFLPIQENLICDGVWNKTHQTLVLQFDHKLTLGPVNTFYLVLTVPQSLEPILKQGKFNIDTISLPEEFKVAAYKHELSLAFSPPIMPSKKLITFNKKQSTRLK